MLTLISRQPIRPNSNTRQIARHVEEIYGLRSKFPASHPRPRPSARGNFLPPLPTPKSPRSFSHPPLAEAHPESRGLIIVTTAPEYNGGHPRHPQIIFIDIGLKFPRELSRNAPVLFYRPLSAGIWGALRPIEQLQQIFGLTATLSSIPNASFSPASNSLLLDDNGGLTNPELAAPPSNPQAEGLTIEFVRVA